MRRMRPCGLKSQDERLLLTLSGTDGVLGRFEVALPLEEEAALVTPPGGYAGYCSVPLRELLAPHAERLSEADSAPEGP